MKTIINACIHITVGALTGCLSGMIYTVSNSAQLHDTNSAIFFIINISFGTFIGFVFGAVNYLLPEAINSFKIIEWSNKKLKIYNQIIIASSVFGVNFLIIKWYLKVVSLNSAGSLWLYLWPLIIVTFNLIPYFAGIGLIKQNKEERHGKI